MWRDSQEENQGAINRIGNGAGYPKTAYALYSVLMLGLTIKGRVLQIRTRGFSKWVKKESGCSSAKTKFSGKICDLG